MKKAGHAMMAAVLAVASLGVGRAQTTNGSAMAKIHVYFVRHSLGFPANFYQFHPGPHWDLMHAAALHLTAAQIREERRLRVGMMRATIKGVAALKHAYRRYRSDASVPDPSVRTLIKDVRSVAHAQAYLGYEMIPYHIKGYRVLDPSQKTVYHHLARENWLHKMHG